MPNIQKVIILSLTISLSSMAQRRALLTSVPFLTVSPDARSAALGDAGVAANHFDANAMYWNPSKLPFGDKKVGGSMSYTPWLRNITTDMAIIGLSGFKNVDANTTVGTMLGIYNSGNIDFTNNFGQPVGSFGSREMYLSGSVARRLSDHWAGGVSLKYISSNLTGNNVINGVSYNPGRSAAGDLHVFYTKDRRKPDQSKGTSFNFGAMIKDFGGKISYGAGKSNFLPTQLKLGSAFTQHLDEHNRLNFLLDINKYLVPSEPIRDPITNAITKGVDPEDRTVISGLFASFSDSPDGFKGELREINISSGFEYWYNNQFAMRAGYYFQPASNGNLKYYTVGVGARLQEKFGVDLAYLIPAAGSTNALANTIRISFVYDIANKKPSRATIPVEAAPAVVPEATPSNQ